MKNRKVSDSFVSLSGLIILGFAYYGAIRFGLDWFPENNLLSGLGVFSVTLAMARLSIYMSNLEKNVE